MDQSPVILSDSEFGAQRELQVAFAAFGKHLPEVGAARIQGNVSSSVTAARSTPVRVIPDVVGFGTELEAEVLVHGNSLEQAHVPVLISRLIDEIADALGLAEGTVKRQLHAAVHRLRAVLTTARVTSGGRV